MLPAVSASAATSSQLQPGQTLNNNAELVSLNGQFRANYAERWETLFSIVAVWRSRLLARMARIANSSCREMGTSGHIFTVGDATLVNEYGWL